MSALLDRVKDGDTLDDIQIIDVHGHAGPWHEFYIPDITEAGTLRIMDRIGIDHAVIFSNAGAESDHVLGNRLVADYVAPHRDRFLPLVFPNPRYPDELISEIDQYCGTLGWTGIKIHPAGNYYPADGPNYAPVWEYADAHNLPVVSHTWEHPCCNANIFDRVASRYPSVQIVLYHSCKPDYAGAVDLVKKHKNLFLELTDVSPSGGLVEWLCAKAGAEKILFGSDFGGWFSPLHGIGGVLYAEISDEEKLKILGQNAAQLFGL